MVAARSGSGTHRLDELVSDLTALRAKGLDRHLEVHMPTLRRCVSHLAGHDTAEIQVHHLESGLRTGVQGVVLR